MDIKIEREIIEVVEGSLRASTMRKFIPGLTNWSMPLTIESLRMEEGEYSFTIQSGEKVFVGLGYLQLDSTNQDKYEYRVIGIGEPKLYSQKTLRLTAA